MNYRTVCLYLGLLLVGGCKNNGADPQPSANDLVKTWKVDNSVYTFANQTLVAYNRTGDSTKNISNLSSLRYSFKADNAYSIIAPGYQDNGTWLLQNTTLTLTSTASKSVVTYKVDRLDGSGLVLSQTTSASALGASNIALFKSQYNVDASNGYTATYTLSPN